MILMSGRAVVRIDLVTGNRTVVSGCTERDSHGNCIGEVVGNGPPLGSPGSIVVEADGQLVMVSRSLQAVMRVDPVTGDRTIVSGCTESNRLNNLICIGETVGSGPPFAFLEGIAVEASGHLVAIQGLGTGEVVRIDPVTGDRTVVSGWDGYLYNDPVGDGPPLVSPQGITVEADGHLVVIQLEAIMRVDPITGDRILLPLGTKVGSGPSLSSPGAIAAEADGHLVVIDDGLNAVLRISPVTRDRTVLSGCTGRDSYGYCIDQVGSGPFLTRPLSIAAKADGHLVVTANLNNPSLNIVVRIDPITGDRTVVSGCTGKDSNRNCVGENIGSGPPLVWPNGIAIDADGYLIVTDYGLGAVVCIDPITGDRTVISGCTERATERPRNCIGEIIGNGPSLQNSNGIVVEADGQLVVIQSELIMRIDPVTGDRTVVSGCAARDSNFDCVDEVGSGPRLDFFPGEIAMEADGHLVVVDEDLEMVMRINSVTGDRTVVSGCTDMDFSRGGAHANCIGELVGSGPSLVSPKGVAVEVDGHLAVIDDGLNAVIRINPITGNRTLLSR